MAQQFNEPLLVGFDGGGRVGLRVEYRLVDAPRHRIGAQPKESVFDAQAGKPLAPIESHDNGFGCVGAVE